MKAGKSSLINALLGRQQAAVDVLPQTKHVQQYELRVGAENEAGSDQLVLLDTAGYADDGATPEQLREMQEALRGPTWSCWSWTPPVRLAARTCVCWAS